jgi:hypothetical protein
MLTALRVSAAAMLILGVFQESDLILHGLPPPLAPIVQLGTLFCVLFAGWEVKEAFFRVQEWWAGVTAISRGQMGDAARTRENDLATKP